MSLVGAPRCSTHIVGKNNSSKLKITSNVVFSTSFNAEKKIPFSWLSGAQARVSVRDRVAVSRSHA